MPPRLSSWLRYLLQNPQINHLSKPKLTLKTTVTVKGNSKTGTMRYTRERAKDKKKKEEQANWKTSTENIKQLNQIKVISTDEQKQHKVARFRYCIILKI